MAQRSQGKALSCVPLCSPRNVFEMYSDTWLPDRLISERCVSSRLSILLNWKTKRYRVLNIKGSWQGCDVSLPWCHTVKSTQRTFKYSWPRITQRDFLQCRKVATVPGPMRIWTPWKEGGGIESRISFNFILSSIGICKVSYHRSQHLMALING